MRIGGSIGAPFSLTPPIPERWSVQMGGSRNWDRPQYRRQGRELEPISGSSLPRAFRSPPVVKPSKASLREEAKRALEVFRARAKKRAPDEEI